MLYAKNGSLYRPLLTSRDGQTNGELKNCRTINYHARPGGYEGRKEKTMENTLCNWAVCFDIDGSNYDDHQTRTAIAAIFRYPHDAENFIEKCTPQETRSRFYVKRFRRVEAAK